MIEIQGKFNTAKIFTDVVDNASITQVQELCSQAFTAGSRIRLMPDIHAGKGCTIGTTMTITDKVVPNLVGVDIGCGMETTRIQESYMELQKLDKLIYEKIPSGFSIRDRAHRYLSQIDLNELCCAKHVDLLRAEKSIGTLGGGNHFIEVDKDDVRVVSALCPQFFQQGNAVPVGQTQVGKNDVVFLHPSKEFSCAVAGGSTDTSETFAFQQTAHKVGIYDIVLHYDYSAHRSASFLAKSMIRLPCANTASTAMFNSSSVMLSLWIASYNGTKGRSAFISIHELLR